MVDPKDKSFLDRIRSAITTVEAWDADPSLLAECRLMIPFDVLTPVEDQDSVDEREENEESPYHRDDDFLYSGNALFLKRLALFFQKDVMTWVDVPPCANCSCSSGNQGVNMMETIESRGPQSEEEREGGANRVEQYQCKSCATITSFPRFNSVRKLLESRKGRCGEYANLFGLYCRAAGFETRYVMDWTDHVWVEVLVADDWIMADSCEGVINTPSMYESGWGKKLNYVVGISVDSVVDITPRYTRSFHEKDFHDRRRNIVSTEAAGEAIIEQLNATIKNGLSKSRVHLLAGRTTRELRQLQELRSLSEWTEEEKYGHGRISGSLQWKIARQEGGKDAGENKQPFSVHGLLVERFHPAGQLHIHVSPRKRSGIIISGSNCDVGKQGYISAVVIDSDYLGCVLQCRAFSSWAETGDFLLTLPTHRVVVLKGRPVDEQLDDATIAKFKVLGGFSFSEKSKDGMMFIGQIEAHPKWVVCRCFSESRGISVKFEARESPKALSIEKNIVSCCVSSRLDESVMPLQAQLLSTDEQKRAAFMNYVRTNPMCVGYTTKEGSPIYIIDNYSFPFQYGFGWNTYHFLPKALVKDCDENIENPLFSIPVDESFFASLLGPLLLQGPGTSAAAVVDTLNNSRLVGLYFSAHWCPPCRRFTPMLIEAYNHLKEEFPSHGLEIVFVSSDRSETEFQHYYASMPWAAVPFDTTGMRQQLISHRFGIQGIPGLVILDSLSGYVVSSADQSRREVLQACQLGDEGIEAMLRSWMDRVPDESKDLIHMLELSCEKGGEVDEISSTPDPYLVRAEPWKPPDPTERVKEIFSRLVSDGEAPNAAAAKAIRMVSQAGQSPLFGEGGLNAVPEFDLKLDNRHLRIQELIAQLRGTNPYSEDIIQLLHRLLSTFLDNAAREPWNPKFRSMKLSNKSVDRLTRVEGTLELMQILGLRVVPTYMDFVVTIPLASDLDRIRANLSKAMGTSA